MLKTISASLNRLLGRTESLPVSKAAQHWDAWQASRNASPINYVDWGDHPTVLGLIYQDLFGSSTTTVLDFFKESYPELSQARALSLCSGDGSFEKALVAQGVFRSVVGTDLSPVRVAQANENRGEYADRLEYQIADVNDGNFGAGTYDVVFAKAALHHIEALDTSLRGMKRCLRPGGRLMTIDFFGATRFQWTEQQMSLANGFLEKSIPENLLRRKDGSLHQKVARPTVEQMIEIDPSEAVRSGELYDALANHFEIERELNAGGTLLNLIFDGTVVNNFEAGNAEHDALIEKAFRYERALMAKGEIGSDFKIIIAR